MARRSVSASADWRDAELVSARRKQPLAVSRRARDISSELSTSPFRYLAHDKAGELVSERERESCVEGCAERGSCAERLVAAAAASERT